MEVAMKPEMSKLTRDLAKVILPLKPKEERAAINAAKVHVAKELSEHYRILGAELRINKPSDPAKAPPRMVGVLIVDYGNRRNFEVLVNGSGKVVEVIDLRGAQPAYTREEIGEARAIAEQDDRVSRFAKMKGSFVSEFGPERTGDNSRRIGLRYAQILKGRVSDVLVHAVVDLSARKLAHFEETSAEAGSRR
jgi:hypothetical protein